MKINLKKTLIAILLGAILISIPSGAYAGYSFWKKMGASNIFPIVSAWEIGSNAVRVAKGWFDELNVNSTSTFNGNVGIGTSTPAFGLSLQASSTDGYFGVSNVNDGEIFVIDENGYVGVGTATPASILDVEGIVTGIDFEIPGWDGSASYGTVNDSFKLFTSAGRITGGFITDDGGETFGVATGTGVLRIADDDVSQVKFYDWASTSSSTIPTDSITYIGLDYNSGSPVVATSATDVWDLDTQFPLGSVINEGGMLHILNNSWWVGDSTTNLIERAQSLGAIIRDDYIGGLIPSVPGTRNLAITAGTLWSRVSEFEIPALDTSVSGSFETYWRDSSNVWTGVDETQYPVLWWNDITLDATQTIPANRYANWWIYAEADDKEISMVYPQAVYVNSASAEAESPPSSIPVHIAENGILIGRILFKQNVDAPITVDSAFDTQFSASQATKHGELSGLNDPADHEYALLIDGSRDASVLTVTTGLTAATGTFSTDLIVGTTTDYGIFTVATTTPLFIVDDAGNIGINDSTPSYNLDVNGDFRTVGAATVAGLNVSSGRVLAPFGTLGAPAYSFSGDSDIGLYRYGVNAWALAAEGVISIRGDAFGVLVADGEDLYPSYSFNNSLNMGFFRAADNVLGISTAGNERMRVDSNGNVGIGTTSLTERLTIKAASTYGALGVYASNSAPIIYTSSAGNVGIGTTTPSGLFTVGVSTPALTVQQNGNVTLTESVGATIIGSNATSSHGVIAVGEVVLEVAGKTFLKGSAVIGDGSDAAFYHYNDEDTNLRFEDDKISMSIGNIAMFTLEEAATDKVIINDSGADVDFRVESNDYEYSLFVDGNSGNISMGTSTLSGPLTIGTSTPLFVIDNSGNITVSNKLTASYIIPSAGTISDPSLYFEGNDNTGMYLVGADNWRFSVGDLDIFQFSGAGIAIQKALSQFKVVGNGSWLDITDAAGTTGIGWDSAELIFENSNIETLRLTSDNKVGIGTTTPDATFHINGTTGLTPEYIADATNTTSISPTKAFVRIEGDGGPVDFTVNPQIADGFDTQYVEFEGTSDTNTVKFDDGNGLALAGGISFTLGKGDVLILRYNLADDIWYERDRSDN